VVGHAEGVQLVVVVCCKARRIDTGHA
jgi:hypothetical protein